MKRVDNAEDTLKTGWRPVPYLRVFKENASYIAFNDYANSLTKPSRSSWSICVGVRAKDEIWPKRCLLTPHTRKKPALL